MNFPTTFRMRLLVALAAVAAAAVVAAGCGGGDGQSGDSRGGIVPRKAAVVVGFSTDRGAHSQWRQLREVAQRVPAYTFIKEDVPGPQRVVNQLGVLGGTSDSLDFGKDVDPWLGEEGGAAGWLDEPVDVDAPQDDPPDVAAMVWFETNDPDAALEAVEKAYRDEAEPRKGSHAGTDTFELRDVRGETGDVRYAVVNGRLVFASSRDALHDAIEAADGDALDEGDRWSRLTRQRDGNEPLAWLVTTPRLWDQLPGLVRGASKETRDLVENDLDGLRRERTEFAFSSGADDEGVWFDAVSVGDDEPIELEEGRARELVDELPASSLVAIGGRFPEPESDDVQRATAQLREALGKGSPLQRALAQAIEGATAPGILELVRKGYTGTGTVAVLGQGNQLALVSASEVEDAAAAREAIDRQVQAAAPPLGRAGIKVGLRPSPGTTGGTEADVTLREVLQLRVSGLPSDAWIAALAKATGEPRKVRSNPLVRQFLRPRHTALVVSEPKWQLGAFPEWGLAPLQAARDGGEQLGSQRRFERDMRSASPPGDAQYLGWIDIRGLTRLVLEPIDHQASFFVDGQLSHVGGATFWSTADRHDGKTYSRVSIELPLYED